MKSARGISAAVAMIMATAFGAQPAYANVIPFSFSGNGFSGSGFLTTVVNVAPLDPDPNCGTDGYNPCRTDPAGAYAITGITGTFTDPTNNLFNAAITGLVPTQAAAERGPIFDPFVPASLSWFDDAAGGMSYSNLYYPAGSPIVCADWSNIGSLLDVYGVAFTVDGGYTAVLWGDGDMFGPGTSTYGMKMSNGQALVIDQFSGVSMSTVPEPGTFALLGIGLVGIVVTRKRSIARQITR